MPLGDEARNQFNTVLPPPRENIALCKVFGSVRKALRSERLTNTLQNYVHRIPKGTGMLHAPQPYLDVKHYRLIRPTGRYYAPSSRRLPRSASGPGLDPAAERSSAFAPGNPLARCTSEPSPTTTVAHENLCYVKSKQTVKTSSQ